MRIGGSDALVLTTDFFTPVVDDAYDWGRIAAANAVSDVYAMGGRPMWALNLAGWPRDSLPLDLLADVLRGGADMASLAGMAIVGGHTVDDPEPKYGMCVVGLVDPELTMRLDAARPGDILLLTKPIGTGIITTALKRRQVPAGALEAAVDSMTTLNDTDSSALVSEGVRACTDVTGFGLLGHLHRMMLASGASARIDAVSIPLLPEVRDLAERGLIPGGTQRNLDAMRRWVAFSGVDEAMRIVLADAQTSGGLLVSCQPDTADRLAGRGVGTRIGTVTEGDVGRIEVRA